MYTTNSNTIALLAKNLTKLTKHGKSFFHLKMVTLHIPQLHLIGRHSLSIIHYTVWYELVPYMEVKYLLAHVEWNPHGILENARLRNLK